MFEAARKSERSSFPTLLEAGTVTSVTYFLLSPPEHILLTFLSKWAWRVSRNPVQCE